MLKRIAVVSETGDLSYALARAAQGQEIDCVDVKPGGELPDASAAVVVASEGVPFAEAAFALAERHIEVLELLAEAIDSYEGVTPGSSLRVRDLAVRFGKALGLSTEDQYTLERAALLRGAGMLRVSHDVMFKKDVLTYDEWAQLQKHPPVGADMLAGARALKDTASVVRAHHECYDGTGYPNRLEEDEIPYLARVLKVLDVYCAMTSARHYRSGQSTAEEAIAHIQDERGKHFDPEVVDVFIKMDIK